MTAIPELEELTLQEVPKQKRNVGNPSQQARGNVDVAVQDCSLYQYLELDPLFDEFCTRLAHQVKIDEIQLQHHSSARLLKKQYTANIESNQFFLRYPLETRGQVIGTLLVARSKQFLSAEIRRIRLYVDLLLGPLLNADRYLSVWQSAYEDALTAVKNRASFELLLSGRDNALEVYSLLVCDVDGFKSINDSFGHRAGDEVLRQFAKQLSASVGGGGTVYRYGGDEFVVALHQNPPDGGLQLAEDIRRSTARLRLKANDQFIQLTTTVGIARVRCDESLDETFLRADSALLIGKRRSKDAVVQR